MDDLTEVEPEIGMAATTKAAEILDDDEMDDEKKKRERDALEAQLADVEPEVGNVVGS